MHLPVDESCKCWQGANKTGACLCTPQIAWAHTHLPAWTQLCPKGDQCKKCHDQNTAVNKKHPSKSSDEPPASNLEAALGFCSEKLPPSPARPASRIRSPPPSTTDLVTMAKAKWAINTGPASLTVGFLQSRLAHRKHVGDRHIFCRQERGAEGLFPRDANLRPAMGQCLPAVSAQTVWSQEFQQRGSQAWTARSTRCAAGCFAEIRVWSGPCSGFAPTTQKSSDLHSEGIEMQRSAIQEADRSSGTGIPAALQIAAPEIATIGFSQRFSQRVAKLPWVRFNQHMQVPPAVASAASSDLHLRSPAPAASLASLAMERLSANSLSHRHQSSGAAANPGCLARTRHDNHMLFSNLFYSSSF